MKYAVIDVGSNSVRMLLNEDGASIFKEIKITKLAKGMMNGVLEKEAIERTTSAVDFFVSKARSLSVDKIYCFATAALRNANNKQDFIDKIKDLSQIEIDVISGEKEAYLGALGALGGIDGGVIDIGGASSEIAVIKDGIMNYSCSLPIGAVSLTDKFSQNQRNAFKFLSEKVKDYGIVESSSFIAIGGTATSIASIIQQLDPYDSAKVHGYVIIRDNLKELVNKLFNLTVKERSLLKGIQPERAEVIAQGSLILLSIMEYLKIHKVVVSESDNLEGYLTEKIKTNV